MYLCRVTLSGVTLHATGKPRVLIVFIVFSASVQSYAFRREARLRKINLNFYQATARLKP